MPLLSRKSFGLRVSACEGLWGYAVRGELKLVIALRFVKAAFSGFVPDVSNFSPYPEMLALV
jgi:hypothetical protein